MMNFDFNTMQVYSMQSVPASIAYIGEYYKRGSLNTAPTIPAFTISQKSTTLDNINISVNQPNGWNRSEFLLRTSVTTDIGDWVVLTGPGAYPKIVGLPADLKQTYPALDPTIGKLENSTFVQPLDGRTYADYLTSTFLRSDPNTYEV